LIILTIDLNYTDTAYIFHFLPLSSSFLFIGRQRTITFTA
jgi:hypothetical protein